MSFFRSERPASRGLGPIGSTQNHSSVLPASYFDQPERRYPVIYMVPSFGGSYREALQFSHQPPGADAGDEEFIRVMLDGQCDWGHHVYADSATNGPRGQALVEELIPE